MTGEERMDLEGMLLPKRYLGCDWDGFEIPDFIPSKTLAMVEELKGWTGSGEPMCFVSGPAGTGKTYMAVATALRWISGRGYGCRFLVVSDWLQEIKSGFHDQTAKTALHRAKGAKLLIMDDLGAELATDWVRDIVYSVINYRYNELLPTLVTSNLTLSQISKNYHDRMASRLASGLVVDTSYFQDRRIS